MVMEKMISEKMCAEYGKKQEDSDMSVTTDLENSDMQYTGPANLPPRLRRQSSDSQGRQPSLVYSQEPQKYPSPQLESWDNEVDDYGQTFTLHHDVHKPITMAMEKKQLADSTNPFLAPAAKEVSKVQPNKSKTGLCDIPLPKEARTSEEKEEAVEEWQEVQTKRKRHSSKEQQKELRKFSAPYLNSAPVAGNKQQKASNFDRLVGRMQQEFPHASKQEVVDAIQKIRVSRGSLSGLSMEVILEKAQAFIRPGQKKIPGLWAEQKKPSQTLNLPPRKQQSTTKPVSLLDLKLPPRKSASVGLLKLDIPPRMQHLYAGSDKCANTFEEDICVICHDPLTTEPVKELDCMHVFHSQCISQWVERERTCPTCRKLALFPEEFPRLGK
ncbi:E3 ubiquitin-protein ligase TTC3-like [Mercenaria mercenaria]|uniref:E3 ubiquitin-protein ligase TTC3-like n=1 Tax=Mercenaria mercenaria TaxID=6596 RepID=UPI00234E8ABE|nr:E3 ubiquitin-protein ligase TTC3-like [Mercenaria mercenaria]